MKVCKKCRVIFFGDNAFCTNCGNPLSQFRPSQNSNATNQQEMGNKTAKTLLTIGVFILVLGIIGSFIMGGIFPSITYDYSYYYGYDIDETYNWELALVGSVVCFISGMCFIGFSEIIKLLQENIYQQNTMIQYLKNQTTSKGNSQQE